MLKYHTTFDDNKQELLTHLIDSDLLVIDDLGTEPILKKCNARIFTAYN